MSDQPIGSAAWIALAQQFNVAFTALVAAQALLQSFWEAIPAMAEPGGLALNVAAGWQAQAAEEVGDISATIASINTSMAAGIA